MGGVGLVGFDLLDWRRSTHLRVVAGDFSGLGWWWLGFDEDGDDEMWVLLKDDDDEMWDLFLKLINL